MFFSHMSGTWFSSQCFSSLKYTFSALMINEYTDLDLECDDCDLSDPDCHHCDPLDLMGLGDEEVFD